MKMSLRVPALIIALAFTGGSMACSANDPEPAGPYTAEFAQAREQAVSDFQREVLEDDRITDDEFRETRDRYVACVSDAGMNATAKPDGSYDFAPAPSGEQEAEERRCAQETIQLIEPLYYLIRTNPQNEDFSALIVECLKQQGVVDDSFTKEHWDQYVNEFSAAANAESDETDSEIEPDASLPTLPGGTAMDDPRVQQCSTNPRGR